MHSPSVLVDVKPIIKQQNKQKKNFQSLNDLKQQQ